MENPGRNNGGNKHTDENWVGKSHTHWSFDPSPILLSYLEISDEISEDKYKLAK